MKSIGIYIIYLMICLFSSTKFYQTCVFTIKQGVEILHNEEIFQDMYVLVLKCVEDHVEI